MSSLKRAGELLNDQKDFDADWTVDDVVEDFTLASYEMIKTSYGPAIILICERDGENHRWVTWSQVIMDQVTRLESDLPVLARVESNRGEQGWYYTLA